MRVAVTGVNGQVALSLAELSETGRAFELIRLGRPELDLARPETIASALERARPDLVVSAAAYTAVDKAEDDRDAAFAVNATAPGELARAAARLGAPVLHLSTDYVFDGAKPEPYVETDPVNPQTVYGASKQAGEAAVLASGARALVVRTSWVHAPFGANFVRIMLRLAVERDVVSVVADQRGGPTYAPHLAAGVVAIGRQFVEEADRPNEILHLSGSGETTWAEFATAVFEGANRRGGPSARVDPIASADFPTRAKRPGNSRLDCSRAEQAYGVRLPPWREGLAQSLDRLLRPAA